jgi:hypothetical protein
VQASTLSPKIGSAVGVPLRPASLPQLCMTHFRCPPTPESRFASRSENRPARVPFRDSLHVAAYRTTEVHCFLSIRLDSASPTAKAVGHRQQQG